MVIRDMFKSIKDGYFLNTYITKTNLEITINELFIVADYNNESKSVTIEVREGALQHFYTEVISPSGMSLSDVRVLVELLISKIGHKGTINIIYSYIKDFIKTFKYELKESNYELNELLETISIKDARHALISKTNTIFKYGKHINEETSIQYCNILKKDLEERLDIEIKEVKLDQSDDYSVKIVSSLTNDLYFNKLKSIQNISNK